MNNVLQALIYFFKYVGTSQSVQLDQKTIVAELDQFGVSLADLESTLTNMAIWAASQPIPSSSITPQPPLPELETQPLGGYAVQSHRGTRVFTPCETARISKRSRGFLVQLAQMGMLTSQARESIIDQLMQVDPKEKDQPIRLSQTKWVTFQTLFHDGPPESVAYLEWLLFGKVVDAH
jgi:uncharacterized protein Smg (DUF494 family)